MNHGYIPVFRCVQNPKVRNLIKGCGFHPGDLVAADVEVDEVGEVVDVGGGEHAKDVVAGVQMGQVDRTPGQLGQQIARQIQHPTKKYYDIISTIYNDV